MILEYVALAILVSVFLILFYGIIAIHDIPYEIAKKRNHPHQDAIHWSGWISLFTLHAMWPFLWVWATLYREDRGWGMLDHIPEQAPKNEANDTLSVKIDELATENKHQQELIEALSKRLETMQLSNEGNK